MTQRELTLDKHIGNNLSEVARDAIHDAMKEHSIEFAEWCANENYIYLDNGQWMHSFRPEKATTEQLYNKFNLNK